MTREEKTKAISELTEKLGASTHLYLTDISGLDAQATSNLRRACYKANISLSMTKNTFLDKAMQASDKDFGDLSTILKGNTSIMFSEVGNAPAKVIKAFRKKSEKPVLKGAYIEENVYIGDD
ncbi:50S ribosomal protein L10, partial [Flavobacteriaceae bacterium]|nr:50S ribosomal protein L10 [Flavobacteriaceae bacterium]